MLMFSPDLTLISSPAVVWTCGYLEYLYSWISLYYWGSFFFFACSLSKSVCSGNQLTGEDFFFIARRNLSEVEIELPVKVFFSVALKIYLE